MKYQNFQAPWSQSACARRTAKYLRNRAASNLHESIAWQEYKPFEEPKDEEAWRLALFASCAGGLHELMPLALAHVIDLQQPLKKPWIAVKDGQIVTCQSPMPAYGWGDTKPVAIWTPLQAAIAGGSRECMMQLIEAGARTAEALLWTQKLPFSPERLSGSLAFCEALLSGQQSTIVCRMAPGWLSQAQAWTSRNALHSDAACFLWAKIVNFRRTVHDAKNRAFGRAEAVSLCYSRSPAKN